MDHRQHPEPEGKEGIVTGSSSWIGKERPPKYWSIKGRMSPSPPGIKKRGRALGKRRPKYWY
ncbi:hypothetical protein S1OALGB6SA_2252, partial [Olavius algarvensis spirochete endosymbiont]